MDTVDRRRINVLEVVGRELDEEGIRALVVSEPPELPSAELLLPPGTAPRGFAALDRTPWRWRVGGDGGWARRARRRYTFDGGFVLTVHSSPPTAPVPARLIGPVVDDLWSSCDLLSSGLSRAESEPLLVYLAVQVARGVLQTPAQLAELESCSERVIEWDRVEMLASRVGVARTLETTVAHCSSRASGWTSGGRVASMCSIGWRIANAARSRRRGRSVWNSLLGEPWTNAITRCRFGGVDLLAGPGVFLPRGVSEPTVGLAARRIAGFDEPVVVDVGTGCGAIALGIARGHPEARILGFDIDPRALRWAKRNSKDLGVPQVEFAPGSLLDSLPPSLSGRLAMVVANVPCVPLDEFGGAADASSEAYVGADADGLGLQRRLAEEASKHLRQGGWLLVQLGPTQWPPYRRFLEDLGYTVMEPSGSEVAVLASARWDG